MGLCIFTPPDIDKMAENSESITCQELEASLFSTLPQILASCYCGAEDCSCFDARRAEYDANTSSAIFLRLLEAQKKAKAAFKSPVVKISAPKDCACQPDEEWLKWRAQCGEPVPPPRLNLQGGISQGEYDEGASPHIPVVPGPPPKPPTPLNLLPGYNTPQEADNGAATPVLFESEEDDTPILSPTLIPNQNLEELD